MVGVPEFCQQCGRAAEHSSIQVEGNATNITLLNNFGTCEFCGGTTRIIEGTFNFRDGIIELLSDPGLSMSDLRRLARVASEAEKIAETDPEQAIKTVEKVSSAAGRFLRRVQDAQESREMSGFKTIVGYITKASLGVLAFKATQHSGISVEEVTQIVQDILG